ncbi:MAG: DMT family transporter [Lentimicrobiaceae bacterium]|nr:DMT family transporter [Lentimicrobiaceae bacterium]
MKQKNSIFVYTMLTFSMLFWGTSFVFTAALLPVLDPISIIFTRLLIAAVLLWVIVLLFFRKQKLPKPLLKWVFLLALFEPFIYFLGETYGLQRISPVVASIIISTIPVFTAIVMRIFFQAKLSAVNFLGIFISLSGVLCMIINKDLTFGADLIGILLIFLAVFSTLGYGVILHKLSKTTHPVWLITVQNTFGFLLFFPLFLLMREAPNYENGKALFSFLSVKETMWFYIITLAVFCSALAFIFYILAVRKIGVAKSNVFSNLIPIITAVISYFLLDELFTTQKIVGIAIVIFGLVLTQKNY